LRNIKSFCIDIDAFTITFNRNISISIAITINKYIPLKKKGKYPPSLANQIETLEANKQHAMEALNNSLSH
jgi:hypothetical protein